MEEVVINISINGEGIDSFNNFTLIQIINNHHNFEFVVDLEMTKEQKAHMPVNSKAWLGKKVDIFFGSIVFKGVVTNVDMSRYNSGVGEIGISGSSETSMLESAPNFYSWIEKSLTDIMQEVVDRAGINAQIDPQYTDKIEHESQYEETDFNFIQRMAHQYHEWLYYDRVKLVFGKSKLSDAVPLVSGKALHRLNFGIQTLAKPSKSFPYNSFVSEPINSSTPNNPYGGEYTQVAINASKRDVCTKSICNKNNFT